MKKSLLALFILALFIAVTPQTAFCGLEQGESTETEFEASAPEELPLVDYTQPGVSNHNHPEYGEPVVSVELNGTLPEVYSRPYDPSVVHLSGNGSYRTLQKLPSGYKYTLVVTNIGDQTIYYRVAWDTETTENGRRVFQKLTDGKLVPNKDECVLEASEINLKKGNNHLYLQSLRPKEKKNRTCGFLSDIFNINESSYREGAIGTLTIYKKKIN